MKQNNVEFWAQIHAERVTSHDIFEQMGKKGFSMQNFFVSLKDTVKPLDIHSNDTVLDAGGGPGWVSIALSPFVLRIFMYDSVKHSVEVANENVKPFKNITVYVDDMITADNTKLILKKEYGRIESIDKAIILSSLQYLPDMETVEQSFKNMFDILKRGGKASYTLNPDIRKKESHIKSYERLDWSSERIEKALQMEEKRLWFDPDEVQKKAQNIGFKKFKETHSNNSLWQSTHMFNFVLEK
jgi:tRNA A58 N-methylase Trm61